MMSSTKNQKGFTPFEIVITIVALVAIGAAGYFAYQGKQDKTDYSVNITHKPKSAAKAPADPYASWSTGQLSSEKLSFRYPAGWTLKEENGGSDTNQFIVLSDKTGFNIQLSSLKPGSYMAQSGGSGGAVEYNSTLDQFRLGSKLVYLIDYVYGGKSNGPTLSGCNGAKKCLVKSQTSSNLLDVMIVYNHSGRTDFSGGPDEFSPSMPGYLMALKIVKTLTY